MIFHCFEEKGLSHCSYAVGCSTNGQIAIIDPHSDIELYLKFAEENNFVISHIFETHIHTDYASGARHLAMRSEGEFIVSGHDKGEQYEVSFAQKKCLDGSLFHLGEVTLQVVHTPGHSPEHISFLALVRDVPTALFSGDFLFVECVKRVGLDSRRGREALARDLYFSVREKLRVLPDTLKIYPTHKRAAQEEKKGEVQRAFTLGQARLSNPFLNKNLSEQEFITLALAAKPSSSPYFSQMQIHNSSGQQGHMRISTPLSPQTFQKYIEKGCTVVDLRNHRAFTQKHIPGSICIGAGEKLGFWASSVISYASPILLVPSNLLQVEEALHSLARVGLYQVEGYLRGGIAEWCEQKLAVEKAPAFTPEELYAAKEKIPIIDVRSEEEWSRGHIAGTSHIPCAEIASRIQEIPAQQVVFVCAGGHRSAFALSVVKKLGCQLASHLSGGILAWSAAGLPLSI